MTPGDEFRPSAALSNDIRHFLNGLNGFGGNPFGANGAGTVRIQAYNATGGEIKAGTAVNFDESKRMSGDAVPMKAFSDPRKPWGVVTQRLADKEVGDCFISGPVTVALSGSGDFAQPTPSNPSVFTRGAEGAPVLYANGGKGVINLGAGTPENYGGPSHCRMIRKTRSSKSRPDTSRGTASSSPFPMRSLSRRTARSA